MRPHHDAVARLVGYFETIAPDTVSQVPAFYASDASFKDPFKAVQGLAAIEAIYAHMFTTLIAPRFVVTHTIVEHAHCVLTWEFRFQFKGYHPGVEQVIVGASHLLLNEQGLITVHRDYWDAAEELYEKLPLVGGFMRWLKRRVG